MTRTLVAALTLFALAACTHAQPSNSPPESPPPAQQPQAQTQSAPAPAPTPAPVPAADPKAGAQVYAAKCASCHGASGDGNGSDAMYYTPAPTDFTKPAFKSVPDAAARETILKGKGNMPPFAKKLTPQQLEDVMAFLRTLSK